MLRLLKKNKVKKTIECNRKLKSSNAWKSLMKMEKDLKNLFTHEAYKCKYFSSNGCKHKSYKNKYCNINNCPL